MRWKCCDIHLSAFGVRSRKSEFVSKFESMSPSPSSKLDDKVEEEGKVNDSEFVSKRTEGRKEGKEEKFSKLLKILSGGSSPP